LFYALLLLRTIEQNAQTINSGINTGSKNGNAIAASISPTRASAPTTISPTPAKTKAKSIATQNSITNAKINPHAPIMASKGLVIGCPFTVIVTARPPANNAQAKIAIINTARIKANFLIMCFALYFSSRQNRFTKLFYYFGAACQFLA